MSDWAKPYLVPLRYHPSGFERLLGRTSSDSDPRSNVASPLSGTVTSFSCRPPMCGASRGGGAHSGAIFDVASGRAMWRRVAVVAFRSGVEV